MLDSIEKILIVVERKWRESDLKEINTLNILVKNCYVQNIFHDNDKLIFIGNNGLEKNPSTNFNSKWSELFKTVQKFKHILTNEQP